METNILTTEEERIHIENEKFGEAWNRGDAKAAASFFAEDGIRVDAMGNIARGRQEIEKAYSKLFSTEMPGAQTNTERGTIRMLTPEFAVWQGGLEIQKTDDSTVMKGYVVLVMKKVEGRWLILEAHPNIFPQQL